MDVDCHQYNLNSANQALAEEMLIAQFVEDEKNVPVDVVIQATHIKLVLHQNHQLTHASLHHVESIQNVKLVA